MRIIKSKASCSDYWHSVAYMYGQPSRDVVFDADIPTVRIPDPFDVGDTRTFASVTDRPTNKYRQTFEDAGMTFNYYHDRDYKGDEKDLNTCWLIVANKCYLVFGDVHGNRKMRLSDFGYDNTKKAMMGHWFDKVDLFDVEGTCIDKPDILLDYYCHLIVEGRHAYEITKVRLCDYGLQYFVGPEQIYQEMSMYMAARQNIESEPLGGTPIETRGHNAKISFRPKMKDA